MSKANNRKAKLENKHKECQIKIARLTSTKELWNDFLGNERKIENSIDMIEKTNKNFKNEIEKVEGQYCILFPIDIQLNELFLVW